MVGVVDTEEASGSRARTASRSSTMRARSRCSFVLYKGPHRAVSGIRHSASSSLSFAGKNQFRSWVLPLCLSAQAFMSKGCPGSPACPKLSMAMCELRFRRASACGTSGTVMKPSVGWHPQWWSVRSKLEVLHLTSGDSLSAGLSAPLRRVHNAWSALRILCRPPHDQTSSAGPNPG